MNRQQLTGKISEGWVKDKIDNMGFNSFKPTPDRGVDLIVSSSKKPETTLNIQVKGRGNIQSNNKYRWFQVRTTPNQRKKTLEESLPVSEAWVTKITKAEVFILVSIKYHEFWIFTSDDIEQLIHMNRLLYGHWKDNIDGSQAEINLDITSNGIPLTEIYQSNLNNWDLITDKFK
jgi:hypothetical protein